MSDQLRVARAALRTSSTIRTESALPPDKEIRILISTAIALAFFALVEEIVKIHLLLKKKLPE